MSATTALALFQLGALPGSPLGKLLVAIVALAVVVLVGRIVLSVAWKLLMVAGLGVGLLYAASLVV